VARVLYRNGNSNAALAFCLKDRRSSEAMWTEMTMTARLDYSNCVRSVTVCHAAQHGARATSTTTIHQARRPSPTQYPVEINKRYPLTGVCRHCTGIITQSYCKYVCREQQRNRSTYSEFNILVLLNGVYYLANATVFFNREASSDVLISPHILRFNCYARFLSWEHRRSQGHWGRQ